MQSHAAVTAYFSSEQLLLFVLARQRGQLQSTSCMQIQPWGISYQNNKAAEKTTTDKNFISVSKQPHLPMLA